MSGDARHREHMSPSPRADLQGKMEAVFAELVDLPMSQRDEAVGRACAGDAELEREIRSLLACHDESNLDPQEVVQEIGVTPHAPDEGLAPGTRVGEFTIIGALGSGGMGTVYEAHQERPQRRVALKILRSVARTRDLRRRFEHEADVLARLQHPGIAQVFGAGEAVATPFGGQVSYIAMELVRGRPITDHARDLPLRERVDLVRRVCLAVQHAHERGVVHRDLKPANILADAYGQPKVLDFGVARLVDVDHTLTTMQTGAGQLIGTLAYMSPEQISGDPAAVDARSDVYGLGVVLYQVLSGQLPLDVARMSIVEAARVIREDRPPPLGVVATACRGDLETIAATALQKEPLRRYTSAAAMADDLGRYLAGDPIAARVDSALYVLRLRLRRYQSVVAAACLLVITSVVFGFLMWRQLRLEAAANARAQVSASEAESQRIRADERTRAAEAARLTGDVERGRLLAQAGNLRGAEDLLWSIHRQLPSAHSAWALWDLYARMPCVAMLRGHTDEIHALAISPDGSRFATGDREGSVRVWDGSSLATITATPKVDSPIVGLAWTPDSSRLLQAHADGRAEIRAVAGSHAQTDAASGSVQRLLGAVTALATFRDERANWRVLVTDGSSAIRVLDEDLREIDRLECEECRLFRIASDPRGRLIVASQADGSVFAWTPSARRPIATLAHEQLGAVSLAISDDATRLIIGGGPASRWIRSYTFLRDQSILELRGSRQWNNGTVRSLQFNADASRVLASGYHRFEIIDPDTCQPVPMQLSFGHSTMRASWWPARDRIVATENAVVRIWNDSIDRLIFRSPAHEGAVQSIVVRGGVVYTSGDDGLIRTWSLNPSGRLVPGSTLRGHSGRVRSLNLDRDGRLLASCGSDDPLGRVVIWDLASGQPRTTIQAGRPVFSVRLAPDGSWIAGSTREASIRVWDARDGSLLRQLDSAGRDTMNLSLLASGDLLVSTHGDGKVIAWNTLSWSEQARTDVAGMPWALASLLDDSNVIIGTWIGTLGRWQPGRDLLPLPSAQTQMVWDVAVASIAPPAVPGARPMPVAATASSEGTIALTDPISGLTLAVLAADANPIAAIAFSDDGRFLLSGHADGTIGVTDIRALEAAIEANRPAD